MAALFSAALLPLGSLSSLQATKNRRGTVFLPTSPCQQNGSSLELGRISTGPPRTVTSPVTQVLLAERAERNQLRRFSSTANGPLNQHCLWPTLCIDRHSGVVLCPGLKGSGLRGLGRRMRCRCLSEMPTDGDYSSFEASSSLDEASSEGETNEASTSYQIDLNLPRRRMLVEFTCNACNSRTQRVINPEAYRRGTVFVQCGGCEVYHQLVDNLKLIQEFDFREDDELTGV